MNETRQSINDWSQETFGPRFPLEIAIRMNHEVAELLSALDSGDREGALSECADIRIMLAQIEKIFGMGDGDPHVDAKMKINRSRTWSNKNGKMQHDD